jgi:amidase
MCTPSLGMDTTCGSYALRGATASKDATIITRLLEAGMLIIGKANLTVSWVVLLPDSMFNSLTQEWSQFKEALITGGWSAVGGQVSSPNLDL